MAKSRQEIINHNDGVYPYHITHSCIRKTQLCGKHPITGKDYDFRRRQIEKRLFFLHSVMAIDIVAYGIIHTHYHLVLMPNPDQAKSWSDYEVVRRWFCLHRSHNYPKMEAWYNNPSEVKRDVHINKTIQSWREQLMHISKFMAILNHAIAVQANKDENMKRTSFWEKRYQSYRLPTMDDMLRCMSYNELNPIRAKIANTPEESKHTSLYQRIHQDITHTSDLIEGMPEHNYDRLAQFGIELKPLLPFKDAQSSEEEWGIDCHFEAYKELVDWTGRAIRPDKRGWIDNSLPPIAQRLAKNTKDWLKQLYSYDAHRHGRLMEFGQTEEPSPPI